VKACGACSAGARRDRRATTRSSEPRCDRNRAATSGAGKAVARGASGKSPAAPRPWAEISAPRIARGPLFRTSRSCRIACVLAVTSSASPRASSRGTTRGDGSSSTRQRPRPPSPSRGPMSATTRRSSRRAGLMGPGVTAYLAPHFGCRLRQSRNSWNSSGLAAGGLPATPCCCFIKSLNFARSSGSCAFLSSHS
jgi:hypothetical protein